MTTWIQPSAALAERLSLPAVPLPVSTSTAAAVEGGRVEPAAIALDVDAWLAAGTGTEVQSRVMARWVASLVYVAATELLDAGFAAAAAKLLGVGVRHVSDDPSLRAMLAIARWDCGHHTEALGQFATAIDQYAAAGQIAPLLNILAARAFADAGRHELSVGLLEVLAASEPRVPLFWDLVDSLERRAATNNGR